MGNNFFTGMLIGVIAGAILLETNKSAQNIMSKGKDMAKKAADGICGAQDNNQNNQN